MKQEDVQFYGKFAPKLEEIRDMLLREIQAMLDSISTDSGSCRAYQMPRQRRG